MATFRGSVWGMRGTASRLGSAKSGLNGHLAGWQGSVRVHLWQDEDGRDCAEVVLEKGNAYGEEGPRVLLFAGPIDLKGREEAAKRERGW